LAAALGSFVFSFGLKFLFPGLPWMDRLGLVFLVAKLIHWNTFAAGYAPMIIAVFFVGGVQLTFLGFLGEYIMAMNARIMDRPLVVEEKRLNFEPETPESDTTRAQ